MINVEVIADSLHEHNRLTTLKIICPRSIWPQMLTHRVFSRNAQSSRAIPTHKRLEAVESIPVMPIKWGRNKAGMQALETEIEEKEKAKLYWMAAAQHAVDAARALSEMGLHKQWVNRLLEPFDTITAVITATDWENFFNLRIHCAAQPEIQELALQMKDALEHSSPVRQVFHLPFVSAEEIQEMEIQDCRMCSAARCARVSYLNFDGTREVAADIDLAERLWTAGHLSPFEHVATGADDTYYANFKGWQSERNRRGK